MTHSTRIDRRLALRGLLGAGAGAAFLSSSGLVRAAAASARTGAASASDYRALVCVYLHGGNDGFNLVVPTSTAEYGVYAASRQTLAIPKAQLLPITPDTSDGVQYGLHPSCPELQSLFASGDLAVLANVGTLVAPMTLAQYDSGAVPKPPRLFSHSDQMRQWQAPAADVMDGTGWAGRCADELAGANGSSGLALNLSIGGSNLLQVGANSTAYHLSTGGSISLAGFGGLDGPALKSAYERILDLDHGHRFERQYAATMRESIDLDALISAALDDAPAIQSGYDVTSGLAQQLRMVARMISVQADLGMTRQVFYVGLGGFDYHNDQLRDQPRLNAELSRSLFDFQAALNELGRANSVVTFTASDFGRTLSSNGKGSDHGWGSHHLVLGGPVAGRDIYGRMPNLALGGPDDVGRGRILPTTSVDQYAATLASWFGVEQAVLADVFPNLANFPASDLGFLG